MKLPCPNDERASTLAELVVAMALVSILLLAVVSGSLFFERTLSQWRGRGSLAEELACIHTELAGAIHAGQQLNWQDSGLVVLVVGKGSTTYSWTGGAFRVDGRRLLRKGVTVEALSIKAGLPGPPDESILNQPPQKPVPGTYRLTATLADDQGLRDSLHCILVNRYEKNKYRDH